MLFSLSVINKSEHFITQGSIPSKKKTPWLLNMFMLINELPVIGSLRLRKEFWDRQGAKIVTRYKGTYGERFF